MSVFLIVFLRIYQSSLTLSFVHYISSLSPSSELELLFLDFPLIQSEESDEESHLSPFFSSYLLFYSVHFAGGFYCFGSEISLIDFLFKDSCFEDTGFKSQASDFVGESYGSLPRMSHLVSLVVAFLFPNLTFSSSFD